MRCGSRLTRSIFGIQPAMTNQWKTSDSLAVDLCKHQTIPAEIVRYAVWLDRRLNLGLVFGGHRHSRQRAIARPLSE